MLNNYNFKKQTVMDELRKTLGKHRLGLNKEYCTIQQAAEYIVDIREIGVEYSAEDWVKETKLNYPEFFNK